MFSLIAGLVRKFSARRAVGDDREAAAALIDGYAAYQSQDYGEAWLFFTRAAISGIGEAEFNLGLMRLKGHGLPADPSEAARWFRKAAEHGVREAQHNLSLMYEQGIGVPMDLRAAADWRQMAESH